MSSMAKFFKQNKKVKENTFYAATKSLCDDDGKPLEWEIKPVSTKEDEKIRDACTIEIPIPGKSNMYRNKIDSSKYIGRLIATSVVNPDLYNAELQDDYGVSTPEDLIKEMVDDPGEYTALMAFIQQFNGFNISIQDDIDEAKN